MKGDEDKQKVLSKHIVMAYSGEPGASDHPSSLLLPQRSPADRFNRTGDTVQFAEYVERNLRLYGIRYGQTPSDSIILPC